MRIKEPQNLQLRVKSYNPFNDTYFSALNTTARSDAKGRRWPHVPGASVVAQPAARGSWRARLNTKHNRRGRS